MPKLAVGCPSVVTVVTTTTTDNRTRPPLAVSVNFDTVNSADAHARQVAANLPQPVPKSPTPYDTGDLEEFGEHRDLVRLRRHIGRPQDQALPMRHRGQQMHLGTRGVDGAADRLAIDRDSLQTFGGVHVRSGVVI